jgi:hypothetical protein
VTCLVLSEPTFVNENGPIKPDRSISTELAKRTEKSKKTL